MHQSFNRWVAAIIESSDTDPDTPDGRTAFFVYAGQANWQLIEEYAAGDDMTADRSYVYGLYIDEVLSMRDQVGDDYYYHQDDLFSVYALTDDAGNVVERYAYGDYGQVSVTAEDGSPGAGSSYGNTHTFTGRILCDEPGATGACPPVRLPSRLTLAGEQPVASRPSGSGRSP